MARDTRSRLAASLIAILSVVAVHAAQSEPDAAPSERQRLSSGHRVKSISHSQPVADAAKPEDGSVAGSRSDAKQKSRQYDGLKKRQPTEAVTGSDPYSRAVSEIQAGTASMQHGDFKVARKHFERAIQLDPYNGLSHCCLGVCLERQNHAKFANLEYQIAAMYAKEPSLKQMALASLARNKRRIQALAQEPLTEAPDPQISMVRQMEDAEAAALAGEDELNQGHFDFAMQRFIDSLKLDKKNVTANKYLEHQDLAMALSELGAARTKGALNEAVKLRDLESAVDRMQALFQDREVGAEAKSTWQSAAKQYADLLVREAQYDHAVALYTQLVEMAPGDSALKESLFRAIVLSCDQKMDADDWGNASIGLKLALGLKPHSAEAHFKLGFCLRAMGNNKDAFEQFKISAAANGGGLYEQRARDAIQLMTPKN